MAGRYKRYYGHFYRIYMGITQNLVLNITYNPRTAIIAVKLHCVTAKMIKFIKIGNIKF